MSFLHEIEYDRATGQLRELYDGFVKESGYVPHHKSVFSLRPDVLSSWIDTTRLIRSHMRLRPFELVTMAASAAIGCKYCILAHGAVLVRNGFSQEQLISIVRDFHTAGLEPAEVHMMDFARKLSTEAHSVTARDIQELRDDGLSDTEITDIALVAAERNFYSRYFDALGTEPDPQLKAQVPKLWEYVMGSSPDPSLPSADDVLVMNDEAQGEGSTCALLTPAIKAKLVRMEPAQVLEVRVRDSAARGDIEAWSRLSGNELLAMVEQADQGLRFFIKKK